MNIKVDTENVTTSICKEINLPIISLNSGVTITVFKWSIIENMKL